MTKFKSILHSTGFTNAASSVFAILVGLVFGFIIMIVSNSKEALQGFGIILQGGFGGGAKGLGQTFYYAIPIIMTGLSVGFAFKTGLFNIGASGQFTVGAFTAILIGVKWTFLPAPWHWIVALIGSAVAGGLWALIPGLFKAYLNVNEVISSIMMNYIGLFGVNFAMKHAAFKGAPPLFDSTMNLSSNTAASAVIPKGFLAALFPNSTVNIGILIAIGVAVLMYIILNKTTFGYELKACGFNRNASRYAGISEKRNIVLSMVIAGALSGLGGGLVYLSGANGRRYKVVDVLLGDGFAGIPIALLGLSNPIGIIFAGIFIAYITVGGEYMQRLDFAVEIIDIITAAIIYFSAFALVFRTLIKKLTGARDALTIVETDGGNTDQSTAPSQSGDKGGEA
jgi:simple sugar transport system permease protein